MAYILGDIVDSIETTLSAAASLRRSQSYDELTEGIHEYPTLQVYPSSNTGSSWNSQTDRLTFGGPVPTGGVVEKHVSVKEYIIHADLYARQRSHINEDMEQLVDTINELEDILDTQEYPYFGRDDLYSWRWSWNQVTFEYAGVMYLGARFIITVRAGAEH
jgi:hypothetical protein